MTRALILGVTGQDGSYLADYLAGRGDDVFGVTRHFGDASWCNLLGRVPGIQVFQGDLLDPVALASIIRAVAPDEVYNLAAVTSPGAGWGSEASPLMLETTGVAVVRLLEVLRAEAPNARFVHASSSAVYDPQRYGAYGVSKKLAHDAVDGYREFVGLWASNAVLYSHTSPRQQEHFLIRRLVRAVVDLADGREPDLKITNLANRRDWGWSPDFARALVAIARADEPGTFVVRSGVSHSVRDALETAVRFTGLSMSRVLEHWPDAARLPDVFEPRHPLDVRKPPGWRHHTSFAEMIKKLIEFEVKQIEA